VAEESTTPDLVELQRRGYEAVNRRDFDTATSIYAPDAVWDIRELGVFEGRKLAEFGTERFAQQLVVAVTAMIVWPLAREAVSGDRSSAENESLTIDAYLWIAPLVQEGCADKRARGGNNGRPDFS